MNNIKSASRVLDMLELFSIDMRPRGVSEVARTLCIPKSSAQAILRTLVGRGYLLPESTGYLLPPELRGGNHSGVLRAQLLVRCNPILKDMVAESGESAFIGVMVGNEVQYVAKALSDHEVRYDGNVSAPRPVYCTSIGLAILAHLQQEAGERVLSSIILKPITPKTITDRAAIERTLTAARRDGYIEIRDANVLGASGVAAPIFDSTGAVVAAVSIGAPSSRYLNARAKLRELVVSAAARLTAMLAGESSFAITAVQHRRREAQKTAKASEQESYNPRTERRAAAK